MATHSSILAWRIPWTEEPVRLHTVRGVGRLGHVLATKPLPYQKAKDAVVLIQRGWAWVLKKGNLMSDDLGKQVSEESIKEGKSPQT